MKVLDVLNARIAVRSRDGGGVRGDRRSTTEGREAFRSAVRGDLSKFNGQHIEAKRRMDRRTLGAIMGREDSSDRGMAEREWKWIKGKEQWVRL